jgi:hypothetical protein
VLPDGRQLVTLEDAGNYITNPPKSIAARSWPTRYQQSCISATSCINMPSRADFGRAILPSTFGCAWTAPVLRGSTMGNSKIGMFGYGLAVGFILVVAFHSPAKVVVAADAPAPSTTLDAK